MIREEEGEKMRKVWYAAYASNLLERRFLLYVKGGVLAENGRLHEGARNPADPERSVSLSMPGTVYFATESSTWGGGRALYDPYTPGVAPARCYLITSEQFADVVAQEMQLPPGSYDDEEIIPSAPGERVHLGDGHYETLVCVGMLDGYPVVTMAAPWKMSDVVQLSPAKAYRDVIVEGLHETFRLQQRELEQRESESVLHRPQR
jgi:hypothetical protein